MQGRTTTSGLFPQNGPGHRTAILKFHDKPRIQTHDRWTDKKGVRREVEGDSRKCGSEKEGGLLLQGTFQLKCADP